MIDIKCKSCDRLLAKATLMEAAIKCPRCKMIFEYRVYTDRLFVTNSFDMHNRDDTITPDEHVPNRELPVSGDPKGDVSETLR